MNIQQFTDYYNKKMKRNLTKNQRIKTIKDYFERKLEMGVSITDERSCFHFIVSYINEHPNESENILEEIYYILEYSFSSLNPNYIYALETNVDHEEFIEIISELLSRDIVYGDFTYKLLNNSYDPVNKTIKYNLDFHEYTFDEIANANYTKSSGIINITFDFKNMKFVSSKSPNSKSHHHIFEYFKEEVGLRISPFYILKRRKKMRDLNDSEFSETTLLIMNLLYVTIPQMGYELTLDAISFTNLDSQNIQGMKMKGTDLLEAFEVLQRIHTGDQVHNLKISLNKLDDVDGATNYFNTTFVIDLEGKLCFIFNDEVLLNYRTMEICYKLQESLMTLLYEPSTILSGESIIHLQLPLPLSQNQIISQIYSQLSEVISDSSDKIALEKYFIDNFPLSYLSTES